jgi:alanine racemase
MDENSCNIKMRDTYVEIDLDCLIANYISVKSVLSEKTKIAAVLKANAYGHGAIHVAKILIEQGVDMIAVACLPEALELRRRFEKTSLLIMGYTSDEYLHSAISNEITLTIMSLKQAQLISDIAGALGKTAKVHIKIDTGFNRLGIKPDENTRDLITGICKQKNLEVEGIFTHLALTNEESDKKQVDLFMRVVRELEVQGIHIPMKHICDSIGMVRYPDYHLGLVRLGAILYGVNPTGVNKFMIENKMPLTFKTRISQIKDIEAGEGVGYDYSYIAKEKRRIGTLPVGYADGYMRCLSNAGEVCVNGKRAPIIGKICMDQCMIDLSNMSEVKVGDEVILVGGTGENSMPIMEVADRAGTNRNEVLSIISRRVPRVYLKGNKVIDVVDYMFD